MVVRDRAAEPAERPAYRKATRDHVRVREDGRSVPEPPSEPADDAAGEAAEARESFPQPEQRPRIAQGFARVIRKRVEHVPEEEAREYDPSQKRDERSFVQAAPACRVNRRARAEVEPERDQRTEWLER